ncbi:MAG: polyphosphate kinase 2 family protein [Acidobacteriales bacterium]|nr:polyphosphate kinase 2 family protein [Terriglobales bacterium]
MSWAENLSAPYRVRNGKHFKLKDWDPADTGDLKSEKHGDEVLQRGVESLSKLQDRLYAENTWGVLLIFQAMDAAGKDGAIKHVMSGVNPEGCSVYSFKAPTYEEQNHDFLWRVNTRLPERGRIGIFNRSYYEEVLIVRVHPDLLKNEKIPDTLKGKNIWKHRFEDICSFERYLWRNGIVIRKFFLNISKEEQKRRFLARLEHPQKNWKFSESDVHEREYWDDYMDAYQSMIQQTSSKHAPWYVVPADNKWYARIVVAAAIVETLEHLNLNYPKTDAQKRKELKAVDAMLRKEGA